MVGLELQFVVIACFNAIPGSSLGNLLKKWKSKCVCVCPSSAFVII